MVSEVVNDYRGISQACILPLLLFMGREDIQVGTFWKSVRYLVKEEVINNLRYADDTVLLLANQEILENVYFEYNKNL